MSDEAKEKRLAYRAAWNRSKRAQLRKEHVGLRARVPAGPFRDWLVMMEREGVSAETLEERTGVAQRTLGRVTRREQENVSVEVVDKCLTAYGYHLWDLYPVEDQAA